MEKIKRFIESEKGKDLLTVLIVILVGISSFELGRLSKASNSEGLKIEYTDRGSVEEASLGGNVIQGLTSAPSAPNTGGKGYFASSRGKKYYSVGCSAGKTIKQENRVYFETSEEAEAAGYTLSSSCN